MTTATPPVVQPKPKPKRIPTCSASIKDDDLKVVVCGKRTTEGRCPNVAAHITKYPNGYCAKKWCEGANPKDWKGNPAPTCKSWRTCPCTCHTMYDMMYSQTGRPRDIVNNSEYRPPKGEFWMPSPEERMEMIASSREHHDDAPVIVESPLPDAVPATVKRSYAPTASGRAARGELESWVKDECDIWLVEDDGNPCTPAYLAAIIARKQGIKEPSVGAINAVFERWVKLGFAEISKKPTRFERYTEQGVRLGLEGCKDKAKRAKRSAEATAGRRMR